MAAKKQPPTLIHTPHEQGYIANLPAGAVVKITEQPQALDEVSPADAERLQALGILTTGGNSDG